MILHVFVSFHFFLLRLKWTYDTLNHPRYRWGPEMIVKWYRMQVMRVGTSIERYHPQCLATSRSVVCKYHKRMHPFLTTANNNKWCCAPGLGKVTPGKYITVILPPSERELWAEHKCLRETMTSKKYNTMKYMWGIITEVHFDQMLERLSYVCNPLSHNHNKKGKRLV